MTHRAITTRLASLFASWTAPAKRQRRRRFRPHARIPSSCRPLPARKRHGGLPRSAAVLGCECWHRPGARLRPGETSRPKNWRRDAAKTRRRGRPRYMILPCQHSACRAHEAPPARPEGLNHPARRCRPSGYAGFAVCESQRESGSKPKLAAAATLGLRLRRDANGVAENWCSPPTFSKAGSSFRA